MKSIKLNIVFNVLKSIMSILFPLITFKYASNILGVEAIGKVKYAQSIVFYFAIIASFGITLYAIREGAKIKDDRDLLSKFSREIILINTITTIIAYVLLFLFIVLGVFDGYVVVICVSSLSILFTTYGIEWLNQVEEDYGYICIRSFVFQIIALILMFLFVKNEQDYCFYAFLQVFATSGYFLLNIIYLRKYIDYFKKINEKLDLKKHIKPIMTIFGVSIATTIYSNIDIVMLGVIKNDYEVGLYTASVNISYVIKVLMGAITSTSLSRLSYFIANGNKTEYNSLLKNSMNLLLCISVPVTVGLLFLSQYALIVVSGIQFIKATFSCQVLSISSLFGVVDGLIYNQIMIPYKEEKMASVTTGTGALVNMSLNFLLIPLFGLNGAAVTTLIAELVVFVMFIGYIKKYISITYMFSDLIKVLIATIPVLIICVIGVLFIQNPIIKCTTIAISSVIFYAVVLYKIKFDLVIDLLNVVKTKLKL